MSQIDRFLDRVAAHLDVDEMDRLQILAELRSHVFETVQGRRAAHPERTLDEVEAEVVAAMGDPAEFALAYGPGGRVELRGGDGRTLVRFSEGVRRAQRAVGKKAAAVGRGTGRAVRGALILLLIAFGLALASATVLTVVLFDDVEALVRERQSEEVLSTTDRCDPGACDTTAPLLRSFFVNKAAHEVRFSLEASLSGSVNGTVNVRVLDPTGALVLDRTYTSGHGGRSTETYAWAPMTGTWRVETTYGSFHGELRLEAVVMGLPDVR